MGSINLVDSENTNITIGLMQEMIPNEGDAWDYMLRELHKVFSNLEYKKINIDTLPKTALYQRLTIADIPPEIIDWVGLNLFSQIKTLAKRTAEMHIALGSEFEETAFAPAHFNGYYTGWLKNIMLD